MLTKDQWLEAIKQTRELWKGARPRDNRPSSVLINASGQMLGNIRTCPFCLLVKEDCFLCIAVPAKFTDDFHACSPFLKEIKAAYDPEQRAYKILDDIETGIDEIMEAIEDGRDED